MKIMGKPTGNMVISWDLASDIDIWLVVWNVTLIFPETVGNVIIPTDELIFFRGVAEPPTSWECFQFLAFPTLPDAPWCNTYFPKNDWAMWLGFLCRIM